MPKPIAREMMRGSHRADICRKAMSVAVDVAAGAMSDRRSVVPCAAPFFGYRAGKARRHGLGDGTAGRLVPSQPQVTS